MVGKMRSRKAQAVLEMGLLGSLILIVFSLLIGYIQQLNDNQFLLMKNFRTALKRAHDENAVVSYTSIEDRRHVNTDLPLEGSRKNIGASSYVYWAVPNVGSKPNSKAYYNINAEEILLGEDEEVEEIIFTYDTQVDKSFIKNEDGNLITTQRIVDVGEDLTYDLVGARTITQTRSEGPKSRTWKSVYE